MPASLRLVSFVFCAGVVVAASELAWAACPAVPGDLDGSGKVLVVDVQCSILVALASLGSAELPDCLVGSADVNCDEATDIVDAALVVYLALGQPLDVVIDAGGDGCPDACQCPPGGCGPAAPFQYAAACKLPDEPPSASGIALTDAFPKLSFVQAVHITHAGDGTNRLFVVEQAGRIRVFPNDPQVASHKLFLDISSKVACCGEMGLLSVAFHPDYAANGLFYVNYTAGTTSNGTLRTVISRFQVSAANPDAATAASEQILLQIPQPFSNHNGGQVAFGPDGYLYIGMGDGGSAGDPQGHGQNTKTLLGAILRIDVDSTSPGLPYAIPADNPFKGSLTGNRQEIYAWGMRNPWRFTFDRLTGGLWVGDVGQNAYEEIDIVQKGGNYGWNKVEGPICYPSFQTCALSSFDPPVAVLPYAKGRSILSGFVYRGEAMPSFYGAYFYGDYVFPAIYVFRYGQEPPPVNASLTVPFNIATFGEDEAGEMYTVAYGFSGGKVYRLSESKPGTTPAALPQTLTETGCFDSVVAQVAAPGVLHYGVNAPMWSDGATQERWISLPEGGKLGFSQTGKWNAPQGTLFVQTLSMEMMPGVPSSKIPIETRLLAVDAIGVRGYSYRWNDEGTDAVLLPSADTRELTLTTPEGPIPYTWQFPSRQQCKGCHTTAAGGVLSLETGQLNRTGIFEGATMNQIEAIAAYDLFTNPPADVAGLPAYVPEDHPTASATDRARSYLHTNCANCHLPGGTTGTLLDLRHGTPLAQMQVCGNPTKGAMGVLGAKILKPGSPAESVLYLRTAAPPPIGMPPIAVSLPNEAALDALAEWIQSLATCP